VSRIGLSFIIVMVICIFHSCDEPVRTTLTPKEKKILDSLYATKASEVRKRTDSICDAQYDSIFQAAKDSFYHSYMKEIELMYNEER
jgi:hypothetical protein